MDLVNTKERGEGVGFRGGFINAAVHLVRPAQFGVHRFTYIYRETLKNHSAPPQIKEKRRAVCAVCIAIVKLIRQTRGNVLFRPIVGVVSVVD